MWVAEEILKVVLKQKVQLENLRDLRKTWWRWAQLKKIVKGRFFINKTVNLWIESQTICEDHGTLVYLWCGTLIPNLFSIKQDEFFFLSITKLEEVNNICLHSSHSFHRANLLHVAHLQSDHQDSSQPTHQLLRIIITLMIFWVVIKLIQTFRSREWTWLKMKVFSLFRSILWLISSTFLLFCSIFQQIRFIFRRPHRHPDASRRRRHRVHHARHPAGQILVRRR